MDYDLLKDTSVYHRNTVDIWNSNILIQMTWVYTKKVSWNHPKKFCPRKKRAAVKNNLFHVLLFSFQYFHSSRTTAGLAPKLWQQISPMRPHSPASVTPSAVLPHTHGAGLELLPCSRSNISEHVDETGQVVTCCSCWGDTQQTLFWLKEHLLKSFPPIWSKISFRQREGTPELCTAHPRSPTELCRWDTEPFSIPARKDLSLPVPGVLTSPHPKPGDRVRTPQ